MRINIGGTWWQSDALGSLPGTTLGNSESTAIRLIEEWNSNQKEFTFHTSGSTGAARPITFLRSQLEASAQLSINALKLRSGMTALACLDTRFVAGALMVIRSVLANMDLIVREPSANPLRDLDEPVDFLAVVPLQLTALLDDSLPKLDRASVVIIGGAPLPDSVLPRLESLHVACYATYGMTETLTHVALQKLNGPGRQDSFHALPGFSVSIDERGCLVIKAPHLGEDAIRTNDLAEWTTDGGFRILGRLDDVINSGGFKVHPGRITLAVQQALQKLGIQCRFFVAGIPDERLLEAVGLVLEGSPLPSEVEAELNALISAKLDRFELPRHILYSRHFTETATQKTDQSATLADVMKKTL